MKKVLWFSRHSMTSEQLAALGQVEVTQVNGNMANVHVPFLGNVNGGEEQQVPAFKELLKEFDIVAIVLPINLEQQVLSVAGNLPVIRANNKRQLIKGANGEEDKVVFNFDGWVRLVKIEVVTEPFLAV